MNWASAGVAAYVDKIILESGYGCTVTVVTGDTMPTFASMNEKGQPDMAPEFWVNAVRTALDEAIAEGRLIQAAPLLSDGGVEGWWIPKFIADANPDIKTVEDALKRPDLFPAPEDPTKAAVTNCPSGWNCQVSTANLYRALGAKDKGFELVDTGSAAGLDGSIANAFENKKGWLGYYWAPTAILGKYEMVKLSFGVEHDKANWDACTAVPDCPDPKVNAYPVSDVYTVVTKGFAEKAGVAMDYVKTRKWDNATVGKVLAWMEENQGTNEDGAKHFLETYPDMWTTWVAPEVAEKVKASL
jgi:glycine betaine/proline transport system substrate-binding protein